MLRNSILVLAGLATVGGVLVANPENAWARRRCCCGGGYGGGYYGSNYYGSYGTNYYGSSANYGPQTYDGTAPAPGPDGTYNYGTNYGPQGGYYGAPGAQGYYDNAGVWHAYGPAGANVQGGAAVRGNVDAQGRPINPNQANPNAGVRTDGTNRTNIQTNPNAGVREDGTNRTNIQTNPGTGANRGSSGAARTNTDVNGNVRSSIGAKANTNTPAPPAPSTPVTPREE